MELVFWGCRGSVPCFSKQKVHFGTNTSCLEMNLSPGPRLIFDAGTGIVSLGIQLERLGRLNSETHHLFFSHFHWDHIQGLPFFRPMFSKECKVCLYGLPGIESVFSQQMTDPFFPLPFEALPAKTTIVPVEEPLEIKGAKVTPFPLNHPQGSYCYRVEYGGKVLIYATDSEPDGGEMDALLVEKCQGGDILIMDSNNTPDESKVRKGWGHSSWEDCVAVAKGAGIKRLILSHHDPFHDDEQVREKQRNAQKAFPETICAYEGLRIRVV